MPKTQLMFSKSFMDECKTYGERHLINDRLIKLIQYCNNAKLSTQCTAKQQWEQKRQIQVIKQFAVELSDLVDLGFGRYRRGKSTKRVKIKE